MVLAWLFKTMQTLFKVDWKVSNNNFLSVWKVLMQIVQPSKDVFSETIWVYQEGKLRHRNTKNSTFGTETLGQLFGRKIT